MELSPVPEVRGETLRDAPESSADPGPAELVGPGGTRIRLTTGRLADGRAIRYYDADPTAPPRHDADRRPLPPQDAASEIRYDALLGVSVIIAAHRQTRAYHPSPEDCPLCPSRPGHLTEIPAPDYEVAVIDNRFPALSPPELFTGADPATPKPVTPKPATPDLAGPHPAVPGDVVADRPGVGRCEVVCFTSDHGASFATLTTAQVGTVLTAWTDRTRDLLARPEVREVFCFENRGREIGVTLEHPHGQIYAYPFVTPRTERVRASVTAYRASTGRNLFDDVVAAERRAVVRVVATNDHWIAFVPHAARWPYEVHLYPTRRVPDLVALEDGARLAFASIYLDVLTRFDGLFGGMTPYVAGWHQAPVGAGRDELALHLELFTVRRAPGRLKYLAGSESGMDAFANDVVPEEAAARLREARGTTPDGATPDRSTAPNR